MPHVTIELYIRIIPDDSLVADATLTSAASTAAVQLATNAPVALDTAELLALSGDPAAYGKLLSAQIFAAPALRDAWLQARAYAATGDLQLRLRLDARAAALHTIRWETLRDPQSGQPIALHERVRLVRALDSADLTPVGIQPRPALRALVVVSNPSNLSAFTLAEVDVDGEISRARAALGDIPTTILGDHADAAGRATLANLTAQLRDAPPLVFLIAHGTLRNDQPTLWLEQDDGNADLLPGAEVVAAVQRLSARPLLLVLASCRSAGAGYGDTLSALGPQLASIGVPAVLGFQGDVAMSTVKALLPTLISELRRDGQIDRALAAARASLGAQRPWWQAVLWLRTDGRLWEEETTPPAISSPLIDFANTQADKVSVGNAAGRDIHHTTINVWLWDRFGEDVPAWLANQLDQREQRKDAKARLSDAKCEELKAAERQRWLQIDWTEAAQTYAQKMQDLYGWMQIFGMNRPVRLAGVFTDVYLLDKPNALRRHTIEELKRHPLMHPDPVSVEQRRKGGALVAEHKRLFILGQPGAGKTTFLKHLVIQAVENHLDAIPIFVSLKDWSDKQFNLMNFLVHQFTICSFPDAQPFIETILNAGWAMVLFDGLDEVNVASGQQQRIIQAIREFAQQYSQSQIVITCRTAATEFTFEGFTYCEVADFTQTEIEAFVAGWFEKNEDKRASFLDAFAQTKNERLRDMARRPLLLTMLCLTFEETMTFPQRQAELYEEAINALLKRWDDSRSIQRDQPYRNLSRNNKRQLLANLAAETFEHSEFFIPKAQITERIVHFIRRMPQANHSEEIDGAVILQAIEAQHGLLIERAHGIYSFSHLTFHEYFAARYIIENPNQQVLSVAVAYATNNQWREVLLLTSSMLDQREIELFFQLWSQQLQAQLRKTPALTKMMRWVRQQATGGGTSIRAAIVMITMIDQAIIYTRVLGRIFVNVRDLDRDLDRAFERNLDRARGRDLDRARVATAPENVKKNMPLILKRFEHGYKKISQIQYIIDIILRYYYNIDKNIKNELLNVIDKMNDFDLHFNYANYRSLTNQSTNMLDYLYSITCNIEKIINNARYKAIKSISLLNQHLPLNTIPEQNWKLSKDQLEIFGAYLSSTNLLIDCLDLAAMEDRQAVEDRLLIPPPRWWMGLI